MKTEESVKTQEEIKFDFRNIKTFEDACAKTGYDPEIINLSLPKEFGRSIIAFLQLMIIFKAVNDGWTPDWGNTNQAKWFPWFEVRPSGSGFSNSGSLYDYDITCVGSRLCTESREKANHVAMQFEALYEEYLLYK
jgi:hypothetical protein